MNVRQTYYPSSYNGPIKHKELPDESIFQHEQDVIEDCDLLINHNMARISELLKRLTEIDEKIELIKANI